MQGFGIFSDRKATCVNLNFKREILVDIFHQKQFFYWPGRFPGIRNAGNHGNDGKFHKSHQILNQTKRYINKLCLGKISHYKTVRIKFSVDSGFLNKPYDKKRKHENAGNQQKAF